MVGSRLGWARGRAAALLPETATIVATTTAPDPEGNPVETTTETEVPFRLEERDSIPVESESGGRITARSVWTGHFPYGTDLSAAHEVRHAGKTYQVVEDDGGRSNAAVLKAHMVRIGEG